MNVRPEKDGYIKIYQDKEWLELQLKTMTVRQIANYCHVSYKLINKWALTYGLINKSEDTLLP